MSKKKEAEVDKMNTEPLLGEIKTSRELGKPYSRKFIYCACPDCGKKRWIEMKKGKPASIRCYSCYGKSISIACRRFPKDTEVHYGEYGVLNQNSDRIQCHICGKWYIFLAIHVWRMHNYLADEYREQFGLGYTTGLLTDDFSARKAGIADSLTKTGIIKLPPVSETKEIRDLGQQVMKGRKMRREGVLAQMASKPRRLWLSAECVVCGNVYYGWRSTLKKVRTCSNPICHQTLMSNILKGIPKSPEHRAKLSEASKKRYMNGKQLSIG